jgi:hypothetical protein
MCDYSLAGSANRLAETGDQLMVHRFPTGSLGLVSERRRVREVLFPSLTVAVCVPPGASLLLFDIPQRLQQDLEISSAEIVTFTQRTWEENVHRDSIRFPNGREILLQQLHCGQRVTVLSLGCDGAAAEQPREEQAISGPRLHR